MTMIVVICGSRDWAYPQPVTDRLKQLPPLSTVIEGGCDGADLMARRIALRLGHDVIEYPANWEGRSKAAGPIRNRKMLSLKPDLVIAFHNDLASSKGTKDCVDEARKRGIQVEIITFKQTVFVNIPGMGIGCRSCGRPPGGAGGCNLCNNKSP